MPLSLNTNLAEVPKGAVGLRRTTPHDAVRGGARPKWRHVDEADTATTVIAMIESPVGAAAIGDMLAVGRLDCFFVGRANLAVRLGDREAGAPRADAGANRVFEAAAADGPVCLFVGDTMQAEPLIERGVSAFVVSSDVGMLREAASRHRARFAGMRPG